MFAPKHWTEMKPPNCSYPAPECVCCLEQLCKSAAPKESSHIPWGEEGAQGSYIPQAKDIVP